jgi:hypothetical protein
MRAKQRPLVTHTLVPLLLLMAVIFTVTRFARIETMIGDVVITLQQAHTPAFPVPEPGPRPDEVAHRPMSSAELSASPRNIVLIIGDGMGVGHLSTASALLQGPEGWLAMEAAPMTALVKTSSRDDLVPDSAAAATALATGF